MEGMAHINQSNVLGELGKGSEYMSREKRIKSGKKKKENLSGGHLPITITSVGSETEGDTEELHARSYGTNPQAMWGARDGKAHGPKVLSANVAKGIAFMD